MTPSAIHPPPNGVHPLVLYTIFIILAIVALVLFILGRRV
jgi:hypothetical protein